MAIGTGSVSRYYPLVFRPCSHPTPQTTSRRGTVHIRLNSPMQVSKPGSHPTPQTTSRGDRRCPPPPDPEGAHQVSQREWLIAGWWCSAGWSAGSAGRGGSSGCEACRCSDDLALSHGNLHNLGLQRKKKDFMLISNFWFLEKLPPKPNPHYKNDLNPCLT